MAVWKTKKCKAELRPAREENRLSRVNANVVRNTTASLRQYRVARSIYMAKIGNSLLGSSLLAAQMSFDRSGDTPKTCLVHCGANLRFADFRKLETYLFPTSGAHWKFAQSFAHPARQSFAPQPLPMQMAWSSCNHLCFACVRTAVELPSERLNPNPEPIERDVYIDRAETCATGRQLRKLPVWIRSAPDLPPGYKVTRTTFECTRLSP